MPEGNMAAAPGEKQQAPSAQESELRAELEGMRSRHKALKIAAAVLSVLFIVLAAAAFMVYRKVTMAKAAFETAFQGLPPPAAAVYEPMNARPPAAGVSGQSSSLMPISGLGMVSGPSSMGDIPAQGEQILKTLNKYSDRPIVKEFISDMKRDPELAPVFAEHKDANPLAVIAALQNSRGLKLLSSKYAARPEFLKLVMEVMNDPEMKPLLRNMRPGMPMPGGAIMPAPAGRQQAPARQPREEQAEEKEMVLDPAAISGPSKTASPPSGAY